MTNHRLTGPLSSTRVARPSSLAIDPVRRYILRFRGTRIIGNVASKGCVCACTAFLLCCATATSQSIPSTGVGSAIPATPPGLAAPVIPVAVTRDVAALALLGKMASSAGWPLDGSLKDASVQATMTITTKEGLSHSDRITIKARASDEKVAIQNLTTGAYIVRLDERALYHNGKDVQMVPWLSMQQVYGSFIPFLLPIFHFTDLSREISLGNDLQVGGAALSSISTRQVDTTSGILADLRRRGSQMTVGIAKDTFLPVQVEMEMTLSNFTARIPTTIRYANYQKVNGIQIPFEVDVLSKGQATFKIVLQNVEWNTGLSDADFTPQ